MAQFTHEFKFDVNGSFIRGQLMYDANNQPVLDILEVSHPLPLGTIKRLVSTLENARDVYIAEGKQADKIIVRKLGVL